jgi:hypothetical protein
MAKATCGKFVIYYELQRFGQATAAALKDDSTHVAPSRSHRHPNKRVTLQYGPPPDIVGFFLKPLVQIFIFGFRSPDTGIIGLISVDHLGIFTIFLVPERYMAEGGFHGGECHAGIGNLVVYVRVAWNLNVVGGLLLELEQYGGTGGHGGDCGTCGEISDEDGGSGEQEVETGLESSWERNRV